MQIGTIQELLQKFFGLCRCGGAFYTFVPQTAKGWQLVLLGTNCQPFFVAYAALQGHLVVRRAGRKCPTQLPSAAQRYHTLDFGSKVVCHETPARFLWILPAQRAGAAGRAPGAKSPRLLHSRRVGGREWLGAGVTGRRGRRFPRPSDSRSWCRRGLGAAWRC